MVPPMLTALLLVTAIEVTVTITVKNVNEVPIVSGGLTHTSLAEDFDSNEADGRQDGYRRLHGN